MPYSLFLKLLFVLTLAMLVLSHPCSHRPCHPSFLPTQPPRQLFNSCMVSLSDSPPCVPTPCSSQLPQVRTLLPQSPQTCLSPRYDENTDIYFTALFFNSSSLYLLPFSPASLLVLREKISLNPLCFHLPKIFFF